MFLRRAALALGTLALVGGLAGCDLPGGTPPQISRDTRPNDTRETAQLVEAPITLTGTLGPIDRDDWYEIAPPSEAQILWQRCNGSDAEMSVIVDRLVGDDTQLTQVCDPVTSPDGVQATEVAPGDRAFVHYRRAPGSALGSYQTRIEYQPLGSEEG
jgi:hypothetical protein